MSATPSMIRLPFFLVEPPYPALEKVMSLIPFFSHAATKGGMDR